MRDGSRGRGDAFWITLNPRAGHEPAGRRSALVLSPAAYNHEAGLAVACPIASQVKGYSLEVAIPVGLKISGVMSASGRLFSFKNWARVARLLAATPQPRASPSAELDR